MTEIRLEELNQFERSEVWELVPRPQNQSVIGTRWVFRNKMNENDIIIRNKARLLQIFLRDDLVLTPLYGSPIIWSCGWLMTNF